MLETLLNWGLRAALLAVGVGAGLALLRWVRAAMAERRERWAVALGVGMLLLAAVYAAGHARLLLDREAIEAGRDAYAVYGDPRMAELNRAEVRGWILDCTGADSLALARYGVRDGLVERVYPLGAGGANLIGGNAADEAPRDFTVERLFASTLRKPRGFSEAGQLHPAGTDLRLTVCQGPTRHAWNLLRETGRPGAVVMQDVATGAVVAYAATGGPQDAPVGIRRYAPPGSVFKLALAALWWDSGQPDEIMPCPAEIQVTPRARIRNFESRPYPALEVPRGMLRVSCNTAAISMAFALRDRLGAEAFEEAYRRYGFLPYDERAPTTYPTPFWNTGNDAWERRISPAPARIRIRRRFDAFEWGQLAIGQGPVDVTPIAVSRFVQAIGNGGVMVQPTLEAERIGAGDTARVMRAATAARLQEAMRAVVDSGTARSAGLRLADTDWDLGGKTGSADVARRGAPADGWFAGLVYGPDGRARYTVVVYLQGGAPGGRLPAGVAAGMVRYLAAQAPHIPAPEADE